MTNDHQISNEWTDKQVESARMRLFAQHQYGISLYGEGFVTMANAINQAIPLLDEYLEPDLAVVERPELTSETAEDWTAEDLAKWESYVEARISQYLDHGDEIGAALWRSVEGPILAAAEEACGRGPIADRLENVGSQLTPVGSDEARVQQTAIAHYAMEHAEAWFRKDT